MIFYYDPGFSVPMPCIDFNELNYYLSKFDYIKSINQPPGKTFKSVTVLDDQIPNYTDNFWHIYNLYYGVLSENQH
jgi:hypothetical protein